MPLQMALKWIHEIPALSLDAYEFIQTHKGKPTRVHGRGQVEYAPREHPGGKEPSFMPLTEIWRFATTRRKDKRGFPIGAVAQDLHHNFNEYRDPFYCRTMS